METQNNYSEEQEAFHRRSIELLKRSKKDVKRSCKKRYEIVWNGARIVTTNPDRWVEYIHQEQGRWKQIVEVKEID